MTVGKTSEAYRYMVEYDPVIPNLPIMTKAVFSFVRSVPSSVDQMEAFKKKIS